LHQISYVFISVFPFPGVACWRSRLHNTMGQLEAQNASAHCWMKAFLLWPRYFKILKQAHTAVSAGINQSIKLESSLRMGD